MSSDEPLLPCKKISAISFLLASALRCQCFQLICEALILMLMHLGQCDSRPERGTVTRAYIVMLIMPLAMRRSCCSWYSEQRHTAHPPHSARGWAPALRLACAALPNSHTISFARKDLPLRFKLLLSFPLAHCAAADPAARILRPKLAICVRHMVITCRHLVTMLTSRNADQR